MIEILSPLAGWATPLDAVPDPVFAERMLGDGLAVDPVEGRLAAPGDGTIVTVHPAGHAVTLALDSGPVLLIHIGLDTVGLGGKGFAPQVTEGQRVAAGDTLVAFDLDQLARTARSLVTPVIVTNGEAFRIAARAGEGPIETGAPLFEVEAIEVLPRKRESSSPADAGLPPSREHARSLKLPLAHGLHARPAARIAKLAGEHDATTEIVTEDGRVASARSSVAMLGLALGHGAAITVRAAGPDAERAVAAIAELIESGMGELLPVAEKPHAAAPPLTLPETLTGIVAAPGMAIGPAFRLKSETITAPETAGDPAAERAALAAARATVGAALAEEAAGTGPQAEIAAAHLALLDDPMLAEAADAAIAAGKSAGFAWRQAIDRAAAPLRTADRRFAERLDDFADLDRRVLVALLGNAAEPPRPPAGAILVAETLYPSHLMALADAGLAGLATAEGGATSHVAIIAAGLGLPLLAGLGPALALIEDGTALILADGRLSIAPDQAALARARADVATRKARRAVAKMRAHEPAITLDGTRIEVAANLGSVADAEAAVAEGAEGCGLLRTEFLFLDRAAPPDEAEQRAAYQAIADALGERPLIVRTLDIGADKPAPWLRQAPEDNPALGLRGIRLQLARRDLLETQFRALLGVRASTLRIMLPMIADAAELRETRALLDKLATEGGVAAPELGIMVETPAAALIAETLAADAAFFSIGSNDLSQYALARDRTNPAVAAGLDGLHPAVLRLIDATVRGGLAHDRWTGVCGGLAALPEAVPILIGLGVTELSVPAAAIAEVKALVRTLDLARCRSLAAQALAAPDAAAVRALVTPILEQAA